MDPRNYLNASVIYAFLPQVYNASTQNEAGLNNIVKGTFLANGYSDSKDTAYGGSYVKVLMEAGRQSGVSPYILAGIIIQEQDSSGSSSLISGTYSGYEGYYNFFNIDTYGDTTAQKIARGLTKAKNGGWNTRSKSIIGGASFCANNYLSKGQDTYYYMNFNMKQIDKLWHQYATNIADTYGKAQSLSKSYASLTNAELDFKIPVYKNMPSSAYTLPAKTSNLNNYYINGMSVTSSGTSSSLNPSFSMYQMSYDLNVWNDTNINISVPSGASITSAKSFPLELGQNKVVLTVKSQSGYTNDYVINVKADKACTLYINNPSGPAAVVYNKGDINGDGKISVSDMSTVRLHLLGKYTITGSPLKAADVNSDGKVSISDMSTIRLHLLGKYTIK